MPVVLAPIECFLVLSRSGVVLWSHVLPEGKLPWPSVQALARDVLLPSRTAGCVAPPPSGAPAPPPFSFGGFAIKWVDHKGLVLLAAVEGSNAAHAGYVDGLLLSARERWAATFDGEAAKAGAELVQGWEGVVLSAESAGYSSLAEAGGGGSFSRFADAFDELLLIAENVALAKRRAGGKAGNGGKGGGGGALEAPPPLEPQPQPPLPQLSQQPPQPPPQEQLPPPPQAPGSTGRPSPKSGAVTASPAAPASSPPASPQTPAEKMKAKLAADAAARAAKAAAAAGPAKDSGGGRTWGGDFKYDEKAAAALDKSKPAVGGSGGGTTLPRVVFDGSSGSGRDLLAEDGGGGGAPRAAAPGGWFSSVLGRLGAAAGTARALTAEDLAPVREELSRSLAAKNVAGPVAEEICAAVGARLVGVEVGGSLTESRSARVEGAMRDVLRDELERILQPSPPLDLLGACRRKAEEQAGLGVAVGAREPFIVVCCGVNGVGKTTSLAKLAFHLKDGGESVMIAACDSFRAGAVEQLKRHADALGVELYQQGYAKDPSNIAAEAVKRAKRAGVRAVLVDTAGRMQNNEGLMKQLAGLVAVNAPDAVLFVGEALVGGDGVNQLLEFDRALVDHAKGLVEAPRRIDGIVLTKFDTVDDKVGAALSMVHATKIPVAYLGVGQQYQDLRRLNVGAVLNALLS
jgi:signal recognition particle receptor subunit alpha